MSAVTRLGGIALMAHDADPDSGDHMIVPGRWVTATCRRSDVLRLAVNEDRTVWSALTDLTGEYGDPLMFTQWGSKDGRTPLYADVRFPGAPFQPDVRPCQHAVFVPEVAL